MSTCPTCNRPLTHCFFPGDVTCYKVALAAALAANAQLVELCQEYEAQWGDDYLAQKWGLKEQLAALLPPRPEPEEER